MTGRTQLLVGGAVALVSGAALATYLAAVGLDAADKWASVLGLFVGLAGLALAVAGMRNPGPDGGQSFRGSTAAGGVTQVSRVGGSVRVVTRSASTAPALRRSADAPCTAAGPGPSGQSLDGTFAGPVVQVTQVARDVEVENQ